MLAVPYKNPIQRALERFGYKSFLSPQQEQLVRLIAGGNDALGILPTGAGKTACYVLPAVANNWKVGVVSPLLALMDDQIAALQKNGIAAFPITSTTTRQEILAAKIALAQTNQPVFIYASPEMFWADHFWDDFKHFFPDLLAIDEAHCVSIWGEGFRPLYQRIPEIWERMGQPVVCALSATIDPHIMRDVRRFIPLKKDAIEIRANPIRPNLNIIIETPGADQKNTALRNVETRKRLWQILRSKDRGPTIVYCHSRERASKEYEAGIRAAIRLGYKPILYHAQIPAEDKKLAMQLFREHERPLVFCTVAFGMGIDRSNIRRVFHFDPPLSLVDYAQQIGRAGRDNLPADCIAFYDVRRLQRAETQLKVSVPGVEFVEGIHTRLSNAWVKSGKQPKFSVVGFMHQYENVLRQQPAVTYPEVLVNQMKTAIALLNEVGVASDHEDGFKVLKLVPGSKRYLKLLELTQMKERRIMRETKRMRRFFEAEEPTQKMLWDIIAED